MFRELPPLSCNYHSLLETNASLSRTKGA